MEHGFKQQSLIKRLKKKKIKNTLTLFKTYYISNVAIRPIQLMHRFVNNEYQRIITSEIKIHEILGNNNTDTPQDLLDFSFVPFKISHTYINCLSHVGKILISLFIFTLY